MAAEVILCGMACYIDINAEDEKDEEVPISGVGIKISIQGQDKIHKISTDKNGFFKLKIDLHADNLTSVIGSATATHDKYKFSTVDFVIPRESTLWDNIYFEGEQKMQSTDQGGE